MSFPAITTRPRVGVVLAGEEYEQGALREVEEEMGASAECP